MSACGRICVRHRKMPTFLITEPADLMDVSDDTLHRWADGATTITVEIPWTDWQDR
jgi:hypothetical protein